MKTVLACGGRRYIRVSCAKVNPTPPLPTTHASTRLRHPATAVIVDKASNWAAKKFLKMPRAAAVMTFELVDGKTLGQLLLHL